MNPSRIFLAGLAWGAAVALNAKLITKPVAYEQAGVRLEGYLAYDDAQVTAAKPAPGVLVVPEWWGLNDYAKGRASAGLDQLLATGLVDPEQVAAIGYCFGGAAAQVLAYSGAPLAGIVSFHGSLIPASGEAAAKNHAKILICHGAVDPFISAEEIAAFMKGMNDGKFDYQFISYAGAVHAFTNPGADAIAKATGLPIAYSRTADVRSWGHMRGFLSEIFKGRR